VNRVLDKLKLSFELNIAIKLLAESVSVWQETFYQRQNWTIK